MVAIFPHASKATQDWPDNLAPWRRALEGKISLALPSTAGALPTQQDIQKLKINVPVARIGRDRGLWCAILEALELFDALWYVDSRLCWSFLLTASGRSLQQLAFPMDFLDGVRPQYVLCVVEEDVVDNFDQIMDVLDVFIMGIPEWNHSPAFPSIKRQLFDERRHCADRTMAIWPPISISCHFSFDDDPVGVLPFRLESVSAVGNLAMFLQAFQEPAYGRTQKDSPFIVETFEFDFNDGPLIAHELSAMTSILFAFPVTALRFGAWNSAWMPPALVDDFCNNALARRNLHVMRSGGLETLAFHPTDLLDVDTFDICWAIAESESLRQVTFSDAWLGGAARDELRRQWLEWVLFALFKNNSQSQTKFHTVTLQLRYAQVSDIARIRHELDHVSERDTADADDQDATGPESQPSTVYTTASEGEDDVVEVAEIERYRVSVHDFASSGQDSGDVSSRGRPFLDRDVVQVVLPSLAPYRSSTHPVRHLTLDMDNDHHPATGPRSSSPLDVALALVWFVGEPLTRLTIIGTRTLSHKASSMVLTTSHLEQILTACPDLERLELYSLEIESLAPLVDPTMCDQLRALVIDRCCVHDAESVRNLYGALGNTSHPLYHTLQALHMCEEDETSIETAHFALKMLAKNDKLHQFVIRSHSDGIALKLRHRFRLFDGVVIAGTSAESPQMLMARTLALLSVFPTSIGQHDKKKEIVERTMKFAATPLRRHCAVVSS